MYTLLIAFIIHWLTCLLIIIKIISREIFVSLCISYSDYNAVDTRLSFMNDSSYGVKFTLVMVSQMLSCVIKLIPTPVLFAIEFISAALENKLNCVINTTIYNHNIKTINKNHDDIICGSLIYSLDCYRYYTCQPQIYDSSQTRKTNVLTCSITTTPSDAPIGICYL